MSISSITNALPIISTQKTQAPVQQKVAAQPVAVTDSDGDNDGSGGVNITPPVNIKA